jgi:tripartite-type tricarboxylate transporter receptor subunit TctC
MTILRTAAALLTALVAMAPVHSQAQTYPDKPIRLILAFPPGGGSDVVGRLVGDALGKRLGQQVLIDNRGGASGNIASDLVARSAPDGYTILLGFSTTMTVNPGLFPDLPFDIKKDLIPITELADGQYLLVTNPSVPVKTVAELIAYAKANPGKLNFSSAGTGSPLHLAGELFKKRSDIDITHLSYKGGGPAVAAVLGNEAQMMFGSVASTLSQVQAGKLVALATTGKQRLPQLPDVPTMVESGVDDFFVWTWYGLLAPAKTPQAIIDRLHDEAAAAVKDPAVVEGLANAGLKPVGSTPQAFVDLIASDTAVWTKVIKDTGIKVEQ